ncbi:hypothetical protein QR680_007893 [Steinernema hermaphroditum]|uniref:G-protein coupled receptors family 1 profile domain-containing protein n=1 Tax=Steinernema hermaphroditum TaxID=289476 RepID=A0AA39IGR7_9BILA|nr:hypothetical protein QR680_007893 [Steinernema hermaphroditum]
MEESAVKGIVILLLSTFGLFGNFNIVIATCRKRKLRNKAGILISLLAVYDTICLIMLMGGGVRMITGVILDRATCFRTNIVYFCTQMISASTLIGLASDRLMAVSLPIRYIYHHVAYTLIFSSLPGVILSAVFTILGIIHIGEDNIVAPVCLPNNLLPPWIQEYSNWTLLSMHSIVVVIYSSAYLVLFFQKRRHLKKSDLLSSLENHERAMKSITAFLVVFIVSWFLNRIIFIVIAPISDYTNSIYIDIIKTSAAVPVLISYSHCYYVYFWRSSEYRAAFIEQLTMCGVLKRKSYKSAVTSL